MATPCRTFVRSPPMKWRPKRIMVKGTDPKDSLTLAARCHRRAKGTEANP